MGGKHAIPNVAGAMPPPSAHPPMLGSSLSTAILKSQKAKAGASLYTASDTIGTTPQGLQPNPDNTRATLLGQ